MADVAGDGDSLLSGPHPALGQGARVTLDTLVKVRLSQHGAAVPAGVLAAVTKELVMIFVLQSMGVPMNPPGHLCPCWGTCCRNHRRSWWLCPEHL